MYNVTLMPNDTLEVTVNFTDVNASIIVSINLVEKTVKWGGAAIVEGLFGELLIRLGMKQRRYYSIGEKTIPAGIRGLMITQDFYDDMKRVLGGFISVSERTGTVKFIKDTVDNDIFTE
jgi:hypothetical protein